MDKEFSTPLTRFFDSLFTKDEEKYIINLLLSNTNPKEIVDSIIGYSEEAVADSVVEEKNDD